MPINEYWERTDRFCDELHTIKPAKGFRSVLLPGELEFENERKIMELGIEIDEPLREQFAEIEQYTGCQLK